MSPVYPYTKPATDCVTFPKCLYLKYMYQKAEDLYIQGWHVSSKVVD